MPKSKTGVDLMNCSSDNSLYEEGEKVWASYSDKWYEAKVFTVVESSMTAKRYLVHYPVSILLRDSRCFNNGVGMKEILLAEENMNIEIPRMLKKQLVEDSEFVTRLGKLVKLPRTPNVDDILKKYFRFKVKKNNIHPSSDMLSGNRLRDEIQEILYGICYYFDKALPTMLLYNNERKQYEALSAENIPPSVAYGAEHLLRLFGMID
ncbi:protein MRG2-like [Apium graveolens]|uniref:protein MRG2-like n=1 Tax=Apium graveolens TaxID=4045 RepID=UPI003D7A3395